MNQDNYNLTAWYIHQLTGSVDTVIDWRCIHDKDAGVQGRNIRGKLSDVYQQLEEYNQQNYGIFCNINALDGQGADLANVAYVRTHVVDLDNTFTAQANYQRAVEDGACFAVQTSAGKFHLYWKVEPYSGNDFFTLQQRKLAQLYDGDKSIIDATRVMRVAGFYHNKGEPQLVTTWGLPSLEVVRSSAQIEAMLQHVNVIEHVSTRSPLGTPEKAAPSLEWLQLAMELTDPNEMDRLEWLSFSAAFKQAGYNHASEQELYDIWSKWCDQYEGAEGNDEAENIKLWNSIKDTETGWKSILRKCPAVAAQLNFGHKEPQPVNKPPPPSPAQETVQTGERQLSDFDEILSAHDCKEYFKNCYFVERSGEIFNPKGRFMNAGKFNGTYGGKQFIISSTGKLSDEPWKAALRSTVFKIPTVDHIRFLPSEPTFAIVKDALGRDGLNTYIPATIDAREGDLSLWFDHMNRILPNQNDQAILFSYMAHCAKYKGVKIPWSPMLQSTEGIGKTAFTMIMSHALGDMYVYSPKAPELVNSGSTFNAWQSGKLMIMVDEIKIDERRELIEILKPMISEARIEIQRKGVDQDMEDNPANWFFFSNYKDAIPINQNGRRYSIFYSALQSKTDLANAGMDKAYFNRFFNWLKHEGGLQAMTYWLMNYPVEKEGIEMTAPETSSYNEAINISRSPMEVVIDDSLKDGCSGFAGGYISSIAVIKQCKAAGMRQPNTRTVQNCLENMGYMRLGRAVSAYFQEDPNTRGDIYTKQTGLTVEGYAKAQGYE